VLSLGAYLIGVAELAAIAGSLAFGAVRLRAALVPWVGAPARLVEAVLAVSTLLVVCEVLGLLGLFEEVPLLVGSVVVGLAEGLVGGRLLGHLRGLRGAPDDEWPEASLYRTESATHSLGGHRIQVGIAILVAAVAFAHWSIPTLDALDRGIYGFDSQWYHLPFAARFAETGQIWDFHHTSPVLLSWFYPANSELLHGAGMLLFERDLLSPVINLGWLALALLSAWCLGRPWGVGGLAVLGAFVVLDAGVFADQAGDARNDAMAVALILAAAALLVQRPVPLVASGLAAGIALGTRLTSLGPVAALTAGAIALARRGTRLRAAAVWVAALAATGGLWYLRNLAGTGSPLPQLMDLGPIELPGPDQPLGGRPSFSVAHYATDFAVWGDWFAPALRDALGLLWPVVLALAAAGAILAIVRGPSPAVRVLGGVAVATALVYLVTPVTASGPEGEPIGFGPNLRYLAPGLALALALLPVALASRGPRWQLPGAAGLGAAAVAVAAEPERWEGGHGAAAIAAGALVALALAGTALAVRARADGAEAGGGTGAVRARARAGVGPAVAVGLAVLAAVAVIAGYFEQRQYLDGRYADPAAVLQNPGLDAIFLWSRNAEDSRIATTTTRQYPLYGTDLSSHVQHVGVERPTAGFIRATSCEAWREAVDAGGYDYVVTALDRAEEGGPRVPPERDWTRGSPNAREVVRDGPASVFELVGPLDSDRCEVENG
jgi:hypothetical protein